MKIHFPRWGRRLLRSLLAALLFLFFAYLLRKPLYPLLLKGIYRDSVPRLQANELPQKAVLLDTRSKEEYEVSHLANAQWVGFETFELEKITALPKDTPIVLYCSIGYRSERIGERLKEAGYQKVYNLYGGIFEWMHQQGKIVDSTGSATERLHGYSPTWGFWARKGEVVYE